MHNHWGARDKANKALAAQIANTPKCARKAVVADEKPDDAKDAGEKADALEADAKANNCAVLEKKKKDEKDAIDGETWTSDMPEKFLKPKGDMFD